MWVKKNLSYSWFCNTPLICIASFKRAIKVDYSAPYDKRRYHCPLRKGDHIASYHTGQYNLHLKPLVISNVTPPLLGDVEKLTNNQNFLKLWSVCSYIQNLQLLYRALLKIITYLFLV